MKEELLKILEEINLDYDKKSENASGYESIKKNFEHSINIVKNAKNIDEDVYQNVKEMISKIESEMTDFKKFMILNKIQNEIAIFIR